MTGLRPGPDGMDRPGDPFTADPGQRVSGGLLAEATTALGSRLAVMALRHDRVPAR